MHPLVDTSDQETVVTVTKLLRRRQRLSVGNGDVTQLFTTLSVMRADIVRKKSKEYSGEGELARLTVWSYLLYLLYLLFILYLGV